MIITIEINLKNATKEPDGKLGNEVNVNEGWNLDELLTKELPEGQLVNEESEDKLDQQLRWSLGDRILEWAGHRNQMTESGT